MVNYFTQRKLSTIRALLFTGIIAFLLYIYAAANGFILPWHAQKEKKQTVAYAPVTKTPTPLPTASTTPTPTPTNSWNTTDIQPQPIITNTQTEQDTPQPAAAYITLPPQAVQPVALPTLPTQVPLPQVLDAHIDVKIQLPL